MKQSNLIILLALSLANAALAEQNIDSLWDSLRSSTVLDPDQTLDALEKIKDGYSTEVSQLEKSVSDFLQSKIIDVAPGESHQPIDVVALSESNPMSERRQIISRRLARVLFMIKVSEHSEDGCDVDNLKRLIRMMNTNSDAPSIENYIRFHTRKQVTFCEPKLAAEIRSTIDYIGEANVEPFLEFDKSNLPDSLADLLAQHVKSDADYSDLKTFTLLYEDNLIEVCSKARQDYKLLDIYSYVRKDDGLDLRIGDGTTDWLGFLDTCQKIEEDLSMIRHKNLFTKTHSKLMERISAEPRGKYANKSKIKSGSWAKRMLGKCFSPDVKC